tara:strand:+ start:4353 stop:6101 length:1749 start_codon:yes stop_codon:yes gene_type:complete
LNISYEKFFNSVNNKQWLIKDVDNLKVSKLVQDLDINDLLARLICSRGIESENAKVFLNPSLKKQIPSPFSILDMNKATNRISKAIINNERIAIFGDYDVDGATSSAVLYKILQSFGSKALIYIPDRIKEGYGPNIKAFKYLKKKNIDLVITVDCGMTAFEEIDYANNIDLDIIIVDHHAPEAKLPKALAVINPNRLDDNSNLGMLAAVGVVFMLIGALKIKLIDLNYIKASDGPNLSKILDLVALGTICDVVPLIGPNRALVSQGLKVMSKKNNIGIKALFEISGIEEFPKVFHAGFVLGPRINAGGRVGESELGSKLLITNNEVEAKNISFKLNDFNEQRKKIENEVINEAKDMALLNNDSKILVLHNKNWHMGVIGIVASRIVEFFNKPAIIISENGKISKGSGRSVPGVNIGNLITSAKQKGILENGGGHPMACGLTINSNKISQLKDFLNSKVNTNNINNDNFHWIDMPIAVKGASIKMMNQFKNAEPFGPGNPEPIFIIKNALVFNPKIVGEKHIRCDISDSSNARISGIAFRSVETILGKTILKNNNMHVIGKLKLSEWNGREQVQMHIMDAIKF